jgi:tRNA(fMet)-specific endonuclease VapC
MAHSGQNRRKHAPARHSFRTLEQLEARLLLSANTLVKSSAPAVPGIILMPAITVSGSQSILSSSNISGTNHLTVLKHARDERFMKLTQRMADSVDQDFATTAVTLEEQLRGWLAEISRFSDPEKQIPAYSELTGLIDFFSYRTILQFDAAASSRFRQFRSQKIRAGSMDLKLLPLPFHLIESC